MAGNNDPFEFDVAVSFAEDDSEIAEEFIRLLTGKGRNVFRDEYKALNTELGGKDTVDHLVNLYARKARYCLLLISRHYPLKAWTKAERTSAQERAFRDADEYLIPVHLDDIEVPGLSDAAGYHKLHQHSVESIVNWLDGKLAESRRQSGPPPKSHDLRSGNVPSTGDESGGQ